MEYEKFDDVNNHFATNIVSEIVRPGHEKEFEEWSKGINREVSKQPGFIGLEILRPRDPKHLEYIIIVRFKNIDTLNSWLRSETFKKMFETDKPFLLSHQSQQKAHGMEQWFELPKHKHYQIKKPAFYKLVIMGVLAVYPLVFFSVVFLNPLTKELPLPVSILISVIFISTLMTFPVMPGISKILSPWLYPKTSK
jgi:antibiotic biosynthesis monooxygenase (ABM) superfamily enzyme